MVSRHARHFRAIHHGFLHAHILSLTVWAFLSVITLRAEDKPNIIYIVADDLGWKDVGFQGATDLLTPNIDKLASQAAKLDQFYVQPMCTPTRAALMTGR